MSAAALYIHRLSDIADAPPTPKLEVRFLTGGGNATAGAVEGTAVAYGVPAEIDGEFVETIARGAFQNLSDGGILFLRDHRQDRLLARTGAGTLTLTDEPRRLRYRAEMPDTSDGRDTLALVERGDYAGASVGFRVMPGGETWTRTAGGLPHRLVTRAVLDHLSPVGRPAHQSSVETA